MKWPPSGSGRFSRRPGAITERYPDRGLRFLVKLGADDVPGYEVHMCWHRRDDNNPSAAWFRDLVRRVGGEDAQRARADAAS